MRAVWYVAGKDLRQRLRDRSAWIVAVVAPIVLTTIISLTFGATSGRTLEVRTALADEDRSPLSQALVALLRAPVLADVIDLREVPDAAAARAAVDADEADVGLVVPAGFQTTVREGAPAELVVLDRADRPIATAFAHGLASAFLARVDTGRLAAALAATLGAGDVAAVATAAATAPPAVSVVDAPVASREVSPATYFGPAMAIFFLFFTVGWGARSLLVERRQGTLTRLLAAPLSRTSLLLGKALAAYLLGLASLAVVIVYSAVVFDARWGDPLAVAVLGAATVASVVALTAAVVPLARTDEQADAYGSMVAVSLALVGGSFFPLDQMPAALRALSVVTPNGWAMRGFTDLAYEGGGVGTILPHLGAILSVTAVCGTAAWWGMRRVVWR